MSLILFSCWKYWVIKMEEIWKDIAGLEGMYQVSNLGRARSLDRTIVYKNGRKSFYKGKLLNNHVNNGGYVYVSIRHSKRKALHRLVAEAFLPNPDNLPEVNHKDENPANNCVDNLE